MGSGSERDIEKERKKERETGTERETNITSQKVKVSIFRPLFNISCFQIYS